MEQSGAITVMPPAFWTAFWAGMAAPVTLFSTSTTPYAAYTLSLSPAQSFSMVGAYLMAAAQPGAVEQGMNDRNAG